MGFGEASHVVVILVCGVAGLVVGSFLNVVIYRLPRRMSVVAPPSHCPACETQLTVLDLVPVASWVCLRARCRHCGVHIPARYPLVEIATGALCAGAAAVLASVWPLPSVAVVLVCALAASIIERDGAPVPRELGVAAAIAALALGPIAAALGQTDRIGWAALGAVAGLVGSWAADRAAGKVHGAGTAVLVALAWTAGWLWAGGGVAVGAWIVLAAAAVRLRGVERRGFVVLVSGSIAIVLASALVVRP